MESTDVKLQCMHMAAHLLGANNGAALANDGTKQPSPEEVTVAAQKLYSWVIGDDPST